MNQQPLNQPARLLVIDDEAIAMRNLVHLLEKEGYQVTGCQSGPEGMAALERNEFEVVLTDLRMDQVDGMAILKYSREHYPDCAVIMITGHATLGSAVTAMKEGAYHYIAKPYRLDEVREMVKGALQLVQLRQENRQLRRQVEEFHGPVDIITLDPAMLRLLEMARQIAPSGASVLITGESGTGKELLARYLHAYGGRPRGPFVAINCGSFNEELLSNELFGHEKGAFTGAVERKRGLIEMADGGTLFLDEIGEMSLGMQVKLLRVLQERELLRIGSVEPISVDVRVIAASNRPLETMVTNGRFREDLYYRLNVISLHLPPLRERRDDVPLLAYFFLKKHNALMGRVLEGISPQALELLMHHDFPGNIRELENVIQRGVALSKGTMLDADALPDNLRRLEVKVYAPRSDGMATLEAQEAEHIRHVLKQTNGNRSQAARILGIDRVSLWRKIKKYGLE
jgi:DNA-binding NtrC family response regulator